MIGLLVGGQDKARVQGQLYGLRCTSGVRWYGRYWGPLDCADHDDAVICFVQDDGVLGRVGRTSKAAVWVTGLLGGWARQGNGKRASFIG